MLLRHSVLNNAFQNINNSRGLDIKFQNVQKWKEVYYPIYRNISTHTTLRTCTGFSLASRVVKKKHQKMSLLDLQTNTRCIVCLHGSLEPHAPYFPRKVPSLKWSQTNAERLLKWVELQTALQFTGKKLPHLFPNHGRSLVRFQILLVNRFYSSHDWH